MLETPKYHPMETIRPCNRGTVGDDNRTGGHETSRKRLVTRRRPLCSHDVLAAEAVHIEQGLFDIKHPTALQPEALPPKHTPNGQNPLHEAWQPFNKDAM